ncbi:nucleoside phosphorylase domain-containing protein [Aspergillus recurvatus]
MMTDNTSTSTLRVLPSHTEFLIGWICVLQKEYRAAVSILDERYDTTGLVRGQGDKNHYVLGRVGEHSVAINLPTAATYGQLHASRIALDMRSTFPRIRFVLLVGIAGGVPSPNHDIRLGDVVLGTKVVPYATGKDTDNGFERTGMVKSPPMELLDGITFLDERMWSEDVVLSESIEGIRARAPRGGVDFRRPSQDRFYRERYMHQGSDCDCLRPSSRQRDALYPRGDRKDGSVRLFQGGIGSDNLVMKNAQNRDEIARRENILCFEMEAIGVMDVAPCLPIRGISDYADGHKNDDWHLYAALAAATCARELLLSLPPQVVAQFSMTLAGGSVYRYITGAVSNPNAFSGSEIERFRQTRESLMERHHFLEELMRPELRKMKYDGSCDHVEEKWKEMQRLKGYQQLLRSHLEDLDQTLKYRDDLLSSQDPGVREKYEKLRIQVQRDEEAMDGLSGLVETTSNLLTKLGKIHKDRNLSTAGTVLGASGEYLGAIMKFLGSNVLFPCSTGRWKYRIPRILSNGPPRLGEATEMESMLAFV